MKTSPPPVKVREILLRDKVRPPMTDKVDEVECILRGVFSAGQEFQAKLDSEHNDAWVTKRIQTARRELASLAESTPLFTTTNDPSMAQVAMRTEIVKLLGGAR